MESPHDTKIRLQKELKKQKLYKDLSFQIYDRINKIKKILPFISFDIVYDSDIKLFKIVENLQFNGISSHIHTISTYNSKENLLLFDDIIKNPTKYKKRYEIFKKLSEQFCITNVTIIKGSFEYLNINTININHSTTIEIKNSITCKINSDEKFNIYAEINHNICKELEEYEDLEILSIKFKLHRHAKDYEPLEIDNSYQTEIKNIKANTLTSTIKNIEYETLKHTINI